MGTQRMSTQINHYVLWGIILPVLDNKFKFIKPYMDNAWDDVINPKDGITALLGYSHLVIGHVIAKSGNHKPLGLIELNGEPPKGATKIEMKIVEICDKLEIEEIPRRNWIILGHYR